MKILNFKIRSTNSPSGPDEDAFLKAWNMEEMDFGMLEPSRWPKHTTPLPTKL